MGKELCKEFMAPNESIGDKADIWSLGCILLALCTCELPKANELYKSQIPVISAFYSEKLYTLINDMLNCDEKERSSAEEILAYPMVKAYKLSKKFKIGKKLISNLGKPLQSYHDEYKEIKE
jgi:serine/threonine protein kinase